VPDMAAVPDMVAGHGGGGGARHAPCFSDRCMLRPLGNALLELLYPPRCAACGGDGEPFCSTCADAIVPPGQGCPRCGRPGRATTCGACLAEPPAFEAVQAGGLFGGPLADAIHAFKYGDRPALARPLARWLAGSVTLPPAAVVVAIPLGRRRRLTRGYDQASRLAERLAGAAGAPLLVGALRRVRETQPQVGRSRSARAANVAGAFVAEPRRVSGLELVLVDDVVTTGATMGEAARVLCAAGVAECYAGAVAIAAL
jgi:ComF family protein